MGSPDPPLRDETAICELPSTLYCEMFLLASAILGNCWLAAGGGNGPLVLALRPICELPGDIVGRNSNGDARVKGKKEQKGGHAPYI